MTDARRAIVEALAPQAQQPTTRDKIVQYLLNDSIPAKMVKSAWSGFTYPGDVFAGKAAPDDVGRAVDLAGLPMFGTMFGAPIGAGEAALGAGFIRRTRGESPDNGSGHMMFVKEGGDSIASYGDNLWRFESGDVPAGQIIDAAAPEFRRGLYRALREAGEDRATARQLTDEANPSRVVNSAGLWDNLDHTALAWEKVLDPRGARAVLTQDGAVVFDPALVQRVQGAP